MAAVLAQATGRADDLIDRLRSRFEDEPEQPVAEQLVLSIGELAPHAVNRRETAIAWLRQRMDDVGKGEEPDIDEDVDAWIAWTEQHGHDVRLSAVTALRHALPGRPDPAYARTTVDALIRPFPYDAARFGGYRSLYVTRATDADARLDEDLPGRLLLARELLRQDSAAHHESGLRIAAALMSRWRSAVPELLPDVAVFVDDPDESNRSFALRVLAMCGTAARPWADRAAAHLSEDDEPYEPARARGVDAEPGGGRTLRGTSARRAFVRAGHGVLREPAVPLHLRLGEERPQLHGSAAPVRRAGRSAPRPSADAGRRPGRSRSRPPYLHPAGRHGTGPSPVAGDRRPE